ncbi:Gfo/Idh/MocA family protein [Pelosinus propionicus]|uniref:Predicted dehydrogenase n=1 Tax=Pelosinus propionicus DSM 13327 TaxID=1123291 RepID=A0A1I4M7G9_9FIRM|nr:Gfo/Idh/MocA family oxidoreductase [Pelosinus propionicus]SFL98985.1 Predicted dehydrogenase [Pelosinus propionicus DSM 13327]
MVRFGVVGTSRIVDEFIRCAKLHSEFSLNAVYSRTKEQGRIFAERHGIKNRFISLEEMAQSDQIDAVYIASPNSLHAEQAVLFMYYGKHVLCEKPIASNRRELSMMVESARHHQVLLMEAMKSTFLPNFQAVKQNLHKIGAVRKFFSNFCQYSSRYDAYKMGEIPNAFNPVLSNGSIMDIGVYCIYPAIYLFGKPKKVIANGILLDSGVDGAGSIVLHYSDKEVIISHSKITNSQVSNEIQGEEGSIVIDKISTPKMVKIFYNNGSSEDIGQEQCNDFMYYEVKEFIHLINKHKIESNINSLQLSLDVMEVIDECRKQIGIAFPADM